MAVDPIAVILSLRGLRAFQAGMAEATASVSRFGGAVTAAGAKAKAKSGLIGALGLVGKTAKWGSIALVGAGAAATKMSIDFQQSMLRVKTGAGLPASQLREATNAIKEMATHTAQGPEELSKGLFHLISLGMKLHGPTGALHSLRQAADLAAMSGAGLEEVTNALGNAWRVHMPGLGNFSHSVKHLQAVAGAGNMTMRDMVYTLGSGLLPVAKQAGVNFKSLGEAMAILADEGIKGYSMGATLRTSFHYLTSPSEKAKKSLQELGLSAGDLVRTLTGGPNGLHDALKLLRDGLAKLPGGEKGVKGQAILGDIFPAGRGTPMRILLNQLDLFGVKSKQIERLQRNFTRNMAEYHKTSAFRIHNAWARLQRSLIDFGDKLRPALTDALVWLQGAAADTVDWLGKLPESVSRLWKSIKTFTAPAVKWWKANVTPIWHDFLDIAKKVLPAVGLLLGSFWKGVKHGAKIFAEGFVESFKGVFQVIKGAVQLFKGIVTLDFKKMWHGIENVAKGSLDALKGFLEVMAAPFHLAASVAFNAIKDVASAVWSGIKGVFQDGVNFIISILNALIDAYNAVLGWLTGNINKIGNVDWSGGATGGALPGGANLLGGNTYGQLGQIPAPGTPGAVAGNPVPTTKNKKPFGVLAPRHKQAPAPLRPAGVVGANNPFLRHERIVQVEVPVMINRREIGRAVTEFTLERKARK